MNRVLYCAVSLVLLTVVLGEECDLKKVDGFVDCIIKKIEDDKPRWTPDLIKEKHEAIDKCFSSNGCDKPEYERDIFSDLPPNFQVLARKMKSDWDNTPTEVKKCLFDGMKDEIKDELNSCLSKQNVPTIKELPEGIIKKVMMMMGGGDKDEDKKMAEMIFTTKINVAKAFRQCHETKGDAIKKVAECFQGVRSKYMFEKMCTDKKSCEKDKLDETCIKRGEEIENACCRCNDVKKVEGLKKIEDMRKNPDADMDSVANMLCEGHNITEMMEGAKECYEKSKVSIPAGMKLLAAMHNARNTPSAPKFQFNKATIDTIADVMVAMLDHEECFICKTSSGEGSSNSTMF